MSGYLPDGCRDIDVDRAMDDISDDSAPWDIDAEERSDPAFAAWRRAHRANDAWIVMLRNGLREAVYALAHHIPTSQWGRKLPTKAERDAFSLVRATHQEFYL